MVPIKCRHPITFHYYPSSTPAVNMLMTKHSVFLLCFCCMIYSKFDIQEALSNKTSREGRFLGLFTIVQFRDDNCDGRVGTRDVRGEEYLTHIPSRKV